MREITIGELLEKLRNECGATKSRIARGLCSVTALNRYEQGEREPGKFLAEALFSRLGADIRQMDFLVDENDFSLAMKRKEIKQAAEKGEWEKGEALVSEYEEMVKRDKKLHQAYLDFFRGRRAQARGKLEEAEKFYKNALEATGVKDYKTALENGFLSGQELFLLYYLTEVYLAQGKKETAWGLMKEIKTCLATNKTAPSAKEALYPRLLLCLAEKSQEEVNWGEAYRLAQEAKKLLLENYSMEDMAKALRILNETEQNLKIENSEEQKEREKEIFALELAQIDISENLMAICEENEKWQNIARHL